MKIASAAEEFIDELSDNVDSNTNSFPLQSEFEDAGDNQVTFTVVDRLEISSNLQPVKKRMPRVNSPGVASFLFCLFLPCFDLANDFVPPYIKISL